MAHNETHHLRVSHNLDGLIQFFEILLFFLGQLLTPSRKRFFHPLHAGETNDRRRNALVDPCQRDMAHLPVMLLRDLLNTPDNLLVELCVAGALVTGFLLAF
jgi:hypothetical protein